MNGINYHYNTLSFITKNRLTMVRRKSTWIEGFSSGLVTQRRRLQFLWWAVLWANCCGMRTIPDNLTGLTGCDAILRWCDIKSSCEVVDPVEEWCLIFSSGAICDFSKSILFYCSWMGLTWSSPASAPCTSWVRATWTRMVDIWKANGCFGSSLASRSASRELSLSKLIITTRQFKLSYSRIY